MNAASEWQQGNRETGQDGYTARGLPTHPLPGIHLGIEVMLMPALTGVAKLPMIES